MSDNTLRQIAQLSELSFPGLQERWRSLFGSKPPAYHRRFLVKRLAYRIQELAYGGLREATPGFLHDGFPAGNGLREGRDSLGWGRGRYRRR